MKKIYFLLLLLVSGFLSQAQTTIFSENMGTVAATTTIAAHTGWQNNGTLTYSNGGAANPADVRATSVSQVADYPTASGGANVFFTSTAGEYGFSIESINASTFTNLTLQFGYRKESGTVLPALAIDYWNGAAWVNVPFTFAEAANATVKWYASPVINLPAGAQISGLKIRFVKTGNASTRVDDVVLKGNAGAGTPAINAGSIAGFGNVTVGTQSSSLSFNITGSDLTGAPGNITVTAPSTDFEVSNNNTAWGPTATIAYTTATLASTPVYVRFTPQSTGLKTGNVTLSGGGATASVAVSGTGDAVPAPSAPVAIAATAINSTTFTANWNASVGATGYFLDVYTLTTGTTEDTLVGWNMATNTAANHTADEGNVNNVSIQTLNPVGAGTLSYTAGPSGATNPPNPFSISSNGWDNGADTKYWQMSMNTTGATNLTLSSQQGSSATGPSAFKIQYKIGAAGTWTDVPGGNVSITTALSGNPPAPWAVISNLALPAACENQSSVFIRWLQTSNTAVNGSAIASGGTSRISAVYVKYAISGTVTTYVPGYQNLNVGNVTSYVVNGLTNNTTYYYVVRANNTGGTSVNSNEITVLTAPVASPAITTTPLTGFGNVCINTTGGPNSFTITGTNLTNADVTVAALPGYTYSTTSGGTYTTTLTFPQPGGAFSQQVFVKFDPTAVQSYNGNITINGGGIASPIDVIAAGAGVNNAPTVTSGAASAITTSSATVAGTITAPGCTAVTIYGIEWSTTNGFPNGTGTAVPSANLSGGNFSSDLLGLAPATTYYYHAYATNAGGTSYGAQQSFTTQSLAPTITTGALTAFGNVCINTTTAANSFTITGTNLTTADVTVAALAGYTYSLTSGGTYTATLTIPQPGGAFSQQVFVKFTPTAVQSYNGNIVVNGGGIAAAVNVAASGAGVNTTPTVTSGAASAITTTTATVAGTINPTGCSAVTAYGIEWSTTNGFPNGTGTQVPSGNLAGNNFSSNLSTLTPSTTYYYHAYATNAGGTSYGAQQSFITAAPPPPALTATALTGFGATCINTTVGPNSFTLNGTNLTTANIVVGPFTGYTFSETSGGTYVNTLTITQAGGTQSKTVFVKFTPTAVQNYNGNIPVTGGGTTGTTNVAVTGSGVNTGSSVTTNTAANVTTNTATLRGTVGAGGCTAPTSRGFEYSGINNFANGTGTPVAGTTGTDFTADLTGLVQNATYYYKAWVENGVGNRTYGAQQTFTMLAIGEGFNIFPSPIVAGSEIKVTASDLRPGYYGVLFFNSGGQLVLQKNIHVQNNYINQTILIPGSLGRGVYRVHFVNNDKVLEQRSILVR